MTAATSAKKPNYFRKRYTFGLSENKKVAVINTILSLLGFPLLCIMLIAIRYTVEHSDDIALAKFMNKIFPLYIIAVAFAVSALLIGLGTALSSFSYLYRKTTVDMHYALPLTNRQRFFADYLSGLTVYFVPNLIAMIISLIILKIGGSCTELCKYFDPAVEGVHILVITCTSMLLFYTICVFATTFCGSLFEAIFSTVAYIGMVPAFITCFWIAVIHFCNFGLTMEDVFDHPLFLASGPIGNAVFYTNYIETTAIFSDGIPFPTNQLVLWVVLTLIITVIHFIGAYFLYKKRKAEDVSKPYVYKGFFYMILTAATFCLIVVFKDSFMSIIPGVVLSAVIWFIMEVITRRGFKRFWTAVLSYGAALCAVLLVSGVLLKPLNPMFVNKLPDASQVQAVKLVHPQFDKSYTKYITDEKVINAVLDLNKELLDIRKDPDSFFTYRDDSIRMNTSDTVEITYYTTSGTVINKCYSIPSSMEAELIKDVMMSDDYIDSFIRGFGEENEYESAVTITNIFGNSMFTEHLSKEQCNDLTEALRTDMKAMTEDDLSRLSDVRCLIRGEIPVYGFYENTLAFLNDMNIEIPASGFESLTDKYVKICVEPVLTFNCLNFKEDNPDLGNYGMLFIFEPCSEDYTEYNTEVPVMTNIGLNNSTTPRKTNYTVDLTAEGAGELMDAFSPAIFNEKPLAVFNHHYYLTDTPENRALLEKYAEKIPLKTAVTATDDKMPAAAEE